MNAREVVEYCLDRSGIMERHWEITPGKATRQLTEKQLAEIQKIAAEYPRVKVLTHISGRVILRVLSPQV